MTGNTSSASSSQPEIFTVHEKIVTVSARQSLPSDDSTCDDIEHNIEKPVPARFMAFNKVIY